MRFRDVGEQSKNSLEITARARDRSVPFQPPEYIHVVACDVEIQCLHC